ncbi:MAG: hypothetical protein MUE44_27340 [Oscillatoriaceae cyanobacterium Prado104]|nr:hypothetical protein [Oscillatoriaceae cyanobacterium Prado104]
MKAIPEAFGTAFCAGGAAGDLLARRNRGGFSLLLGERFQRCKKRVAALGTREIGSILPQVTSIGQHKGYNCAL